MIVKGADGSPPMGIELDRSSAVPIAVQLEEQLTWLIATGELRAGERLPSIRRLGAALGIHHHTVRQAYRELSGRGLVVVRHGAAATVGEFSGLRQARPRSATAAVTWGVLIPAHAPFYQPFLRGIELVAAEAHALTVLSPTENNPVKAKLQMHQMIAAGVRGIIAASLGQLVHDEFGIDRPGDAIPVVYADQPLQTEDSIVYDGAGAGHVMAAHLGDHGHRRVALMSPTLEYPNMADVRRGFARAEDEGLLDVVDDLLCADFDVDAGEQAATTALTGANPPAAIATTGDELAIGVLGAARRLGIRIPQDLALISHGAIEATAYVNPPITTVLLPAEDMGRLAARRLAARIGGAPAEGRSILPASLVVRASCGRH